MEIILGGIKMICPLCKGTTLGKVGSNQYFCSECLLEFYRNETNITMYSIDDTGDLQFAGQIELDHNTEDVSNVGERIQ